MDIGSFSECRRRNLLELHQQMRSLIPPGQTLTVAEIGERLGRSRHLNQHLIRMRKVGLLRYAIRGTGIEILEYLEYEDECKA